jgi:bacterioferritin-associated ferredoxin
MYVCVCHGITERQIRRAIDQGASSLAEIQQVLPVGGCCGRCEDSARDVIREYADQGCTRSSGSAPAFA